MCTNVSNMHIWDVIVADMIVTVHIYGRDSRLPCAKKSSSHQTNERALTVPAITTGVINISYPSDYDYVV